MTFRREVVRVVEIWSVLLHILVSFIDIINNSVYPRIVGVLQPHQTHDGHEEVVNHMALVE